MVIKECNPKSFQSNEPYMSELYPPMGGAILNKAPLSWAEKRVCPDEDEKSVHNRNGRVSE